MKMTRFKKTLSLIFCFVLIAAIALFTTGCNGNNDTGSNSTTLPATQETPEKVDAKVVGEGEKNFMFSVTDIDGKTTEFHVFTNKATVGEALLDAKLIEGEDGQYGLYVKKVNGITADYDVDQTYWAFYVDGAYASSGVDATEITEGSTYSFRQEK